MSFGEYHTTIGTLIKKEFHKNKVLIEVEFLWIWHLDRVSKLKHDPLASWKSNGVLADNGEASNCW